MNDIFREFVIETHENLAQLDLDLLALEQVPEDREAIARVFRVLHTVKGTAGFLGFQKLQQVSHAAESVLSRVRSGELAFEAPLPNLLLQVVDTIRELLACLETNRQEGDLSLTNLLAALEPFAEGRERPTLTSPTAAVQAPIVLWETTGRESALDSPTIPMQSFSPAHPHSLSPPVTPTSTAVASPSIVDWPLNASRESDRPSATLQPELSSSSFATELKSAPTPSSAMPPLGSRASETSIRVDVELLEKLMNLVGELVLTRNQILQCSSESAHPALAVAAQRLNQITTELQAGAMKTRMQPIGSLFTKYPRLVRDLSAACGKQVRLLLEGHETELDKSILDAIRDPLTHLLRNAIDHGIEPPSERIEAGKPAEGLLRLRASHRGGKVTIELDDDGRGIDRDRLRDKALRLGWLTPERAHAASDRDLQELIFRPGFSTTEKVTQFSGRGVGMDVVRTNVEAIRGSVHLDSRFGQGTTVRLNIPLTIAILPALIVTAHEALFAIPQGFLRELVQIHSSQPGAPRVEVVQGVRLLRLRQDLIPLIDLATTLKLPSSHEVESIAVVLEAEGRRLALRVDSIQDSSEIVVKPLQPQLREIEIYAGATILGDGKTALILDIPSLLRRVLGVGNSEVDPVSIEASIHQDPPPNVDNQSVLVVALGEDHWAIELNDVDRLETVSLEQLAKQSPSGCIPYRDELLPLVSLSDVASDTPSQDSPRDHVSELGLPVIVYRQAEQAIGFWIDRIIDIRNDSVVRNQIASRDSGVRYTVVIDGNAIDCLDLSNLAQRWQRWGKESRR